MVDETTEGRKGRATPSRKDAEQARKAAMKTPTSRKDQVKRERAARDEARVKQREAMRSGTDDRYLPARERGPVRRYCRDFVDSRRNFAEYLLPLLIITLLAMYVGSAISPKVAAYFTAFVYPFMILGTILDEVLMVRRLKRELAARWSKDETRGAVAYSVLRSTQFRRLRLPKPQIARGESLEGRRYS